MILALRSVGTSLCGATFQAHSILGSGARLQACVGQIIHNVLDSLSRRVAMNTAAAVAAKARNQSQRTPSLADAYSHTSNYSEVSTPAITASEVKSELGSAYSLPPQSLPTVENPYSSALPLAQPQYPVYPDNIATTQSPYQNNLYAHQQSIAVPQQPPQPIASPYGPQPGVQYYPTQDPQNGPANEWLRWGQAHMTAYPQASPRAYMNTTASMLMNISARTASMQNGSQTDPAMNDPTNQWPISVFNLGQHSMNPPG